MVLPTCSVLIICCSLFNPLLKLILPKLPGAADLKTRELAFAGQTGDGKRMEFEHTGKEQQILTDPTSSWKRKRPTGCWRSVAVGG